MTDFGRRAIPPDHASRHEDGGVDEIDASLLDNRINFVDRGDLSQVDFAVGDLTTDNNWIDLDLSSLVPSGTFAVDLFVALLDNATDSLIKFRKNGNSDDFNVYKIRTQVANVLTENQAMIFCDSDRKIEYKAENVSWTVLNLTVVGYWI